MAIAHDQKTRFPTTAGTTDVTTGDRTFTHTPIGTPKAVVVMICVSSAAAPVTGVLYGGVKCTLARERTDLTEAGRVQIWVLERRDVPTGAQTVTLQGCIAAAKFVTCCTVTTATTHAKVADAQDAGSSSGANPTVVLSRSVNSMCYGALHTGAAAPSASPLAGVTLVDSADYGALAAQTIRATAVGTGAFNLGVTLGADDYAIAGVALVEWDAPAGTSLSTQEEGTYTLEQTAASPQILNAVVKAGGNRLLVVEVTGENDGGNGVEVSSVTWGALSLTRLDHQHGSWGLAEIWYYEDPPQGVDNITVNFNTSDQAHVLAVVYNGANVGGTLFLTPIKQNGINSTVTVTFPTVPDPTTIMIDAISVDGTGFAVNGVVGQQNYYTDGDLGHVSRFDWILGTVDGAFTHSWTGAHEYVIVATGVLQKTSGTVHTKAGSTVAGTTLAGADVSERAEAGSVATEPINSGTKSTTLNKAGSISTRSIHSAIDSFNPAELGSIIASAIVSGGRIREIAKLGSIITKAMHSGPDQATYSETGAIITDPLHSGGDVSEHAELGALLTGVLLAGASLKETAGRTGSITTRAIHSGLDSFQPVESGSLVADTLHSGTKSTERNETGAIIADTNLSGADALEYAEAATVIARSILAGVDQPEYAKLGSLLTKALHSGSDSFNASEAGAVIARSILAGVASKVGAGKTGAVAAGSLLSGAKSAERSRLGSTTTGARVSGWDSYTAAEMGTLIAGTFGSGADRAEHSETGSLTAGTAHDSVRGVSRSKSGSLITAGLLAGVALDVALGQIKTFLAGGRVGRPGSGKVGRGGVGRVDDGSAGNVEERYK